MSEAAIPTSRPRMGWLQRALVGALALLVLAAAGIYVYLRAHDGPIGPIPGGPLRSGELVTDRDVDWVAATDGAILRPVEIGETFALQLVEPPWSRTTGVMLYEGALYVPCDLGFMWGRFEGSARRTLHLIYLLKDWHEKAERDGRVLIRMAGKRYERQAVRVTDPATLTALKAQLEDMAREWIAPDELGPPPTQGPRDIWFFRLDPRPAA